MFPGRKVGISVKKKNGGNVKGINVMGSKRDGDWDIGRSKREMKAVRGDKKKAHHRRWGRPCVSMNSDGEKSCVYHRRKVLGRKYEVSLTKKYS